MAFCTTLASPVSSLYLGREFLQCCKKMQPLCVPLSTIRFLPVGTALQSPLPPARPSPLPVRRLVASIMSLKSSSFLPPLLPSPMIDSSRQGHPNDLEVAYPLGSGLSDAKAFFHPFHKMAGVLMPDVVPNKHIIFSFSAPSLLVLGFSQ